MKRVIASIFSLIVTISAFSQNEETNKSFYQDIEGYGRVGYNIGCNAPLPMPATIRSLNSYTLQPNVSFGVDAYKPITARWGAMVGIHFENKGMHIDADVKNYHMEIVKGNANCRAFLPERIILAQLNGCLPSRYKPYTALDRT